MLQYVTYIDKSTLYSDSRFSVGKFDKSVNGEPRGMTTNNAKNLLLCFVSLSLYTKYRLEEIRGDNLRDDDEPQLAAYTFSFTFSVASHVYWHEDE